VGTLVARDGIANVMIDFTEHAHQRFRDVARKKDR
jgi:hypothetical protein